MTYSLEDITPKPEELPSFEYDWQKNTPYIFKGLAIVIEYLAGDVRSKVKDSGLIISNTMPSAYGYILRTTDVHGEEIDMYLASNPDHVSSIYIIDQIDPSSGMFDEHKVMLGFGSIHEVIYTYTEVFSDGSGMDRIGAITEFPNDTFKEWIGSEGYSLQPASKYSLDGVHSVIYKGFSKPKANPKSLPKPLDEAGGVVIDLPDTSKGPRLLTSVGEDGFINYTLHLNGSLETYKWTNVVDTFCRTLDLASETDTVHIYLSSPGGSVSLMGRIVSAMLTTKAKTITYAKGGVASAATTIWAAGQERHILPGAYFMQHMSSQLLTGKSSDITSIGAFCVDYITRQLQPLVTCGLFTIEEIDDMIQKSSDVFISGRDAIKRVGEVSGIYTDKNQ